MALKLPTRLASEPLVEVVSEMRFDAPGDIAVNLLPGILHEKFGPFDRQERTFPGLLPPEILASDPTFVFRPQVLLIKDNRIIQVGPRMVSVACRAPYPGWTEFSARVREIFDVVCRQSFVSAFEWLSLKYVDVVIRGNESPTLGWLDANVELAGTRIEAQPSNVRVEFADGPLTTVVQIASPVRTQSEGGIGATVEGVLVDVDTIHREPFEDFASQYPDLLDRLHGTNKAQFFSLLTEETIHRLGPEYS